MINLIEWFAFGFVLGLGCVLWGYWLGRRHERRDWRDAMKFTMGPDDLAPTVPHLERDTAAAIRSADDLLLRMRENKR